MVTPFFLTSIIGFIRSMGLRGQNPLVHDDVIDLTYFGKELISND